MYKAITIHQPWATLIADGFKRFETRHWQTSYRGHLYIHAGKKWDSGLQLYWNKLRDEFDNDLDCYSYNFKMPLGCIVAVCNLKAIHKTETILEDISEVEYRVGDYSRGRYAWELEVVKLPPEPIPAKGQQGIWNWVYQPSVR